MKVVILAGGKGTRLSEETTQIPKPMIQVGGKPILWHIMKHYSFYGHNEFIVLTGYLGNCIKEYFANYFLHHSDVTFDIENGKMEVHENCSEPWQVTLIDTGLETLTAGRIKRAEHHLSGEPFLLTYGDGVSDVNINKLLDFHKKNGGTLTLTSILPESRYGMLRVNHSGCVTAFLEKPLETEESINGGFFACEPELFSYLPEKPECDRVMLERTPMENLANDGKLYAYKHTGFWQCMDTLRDREMLESLWQSNLPPWKVY